MSKQQECKVGLSVQMCDTSCMQAMQALSHACHNALVAEQTDRTFEPLCTLQLAESMGSAQAPNQVKNTSIHALSSKAVALVLCNQRVLSLLFNVFSCPFLFRGILQTVLRCNTYVTYAV